MTRTSHILRLALCGAMALLRTIAWGQPSRVPDSFVATTEEGVYKLYDRMLDSARLSNMYIVSEPMYEDFFSIGFFDEISSRDTIMIFEPNKSELIDRKRFYRAYISNSQSIAFYERFMDYLKDVELKESYFLRRETTAPLRIIRSLLIKRYESGKLSQSDREETLRLMEKATLRMINDERRLFSVVNYPYITDSIRQALVDAIENPFYPTEYLDYYMSQQKPLIVDTAGIPEKFIARMRRMNRLEISSESDVLPFTEEEKSYYQRLRTYLYYERMGEQWGGLSAEEAYWEKKGRDFEMMGGTGYLPINDIVRYAYEAQDKLIIEHLMQFKETHPDYPLEYF